jgi:hypothetical protein
MNGRGWSAVLSLLAVLTLCLLEFCLRRSISLVHEFEAVLFSLQGMVLSCLVIWSGTFIFLTLRMLDWLLVIFLLIAGTFYCFAQHPVSDAPLLIFGVMLGKCAFVLLRCNKGGNPADRPAYHSSPVTFSSGLVLLLAFSSFWHLDMSNNYYHGPRWMGLWDNPNTYGMLMGSGGALAAGLLAANAKLKIKNSKLFWFPCVALVMLGVGLVMSYSRGAWLATSIGLLYLAWCYGKLKWKYLALSLGLGALGVLLFWSHTPDSAPWYIKRADLGRPSAQHRATAWRAGLEIMCDHPFGVGWNNAVSVYEKNYSPPENGAAAITTNDYLMIGTELGIPALLCFVVYVALQFGVGRWKLGAREKSARGDARPTALDIGLETIDSTNIACRAGAIVFLVAFWFDGGLFKLPTAALFWVLLELGSNRHRPKISTVQSA